MEFNKPDHLNVITGDISENFKHFKDEIEVYFEATETDKKSNKVQVARLKNLLGSDALKLYKTLNKGIDENETESVVHILKTLEKHCVSKRNETILIHKFFSRRQQEGEPFDKFYMDLRTLIDPCQFDSQENKILRTQIILGIKSDQTKERLLREDAPLEKIVQFCRSVEQTESDMKCITENRNVSILTKRINADDNWQQVPKYSFNNFKGENSNQLSDLGTFNSNNLRPCYRCGRSHDNRACPAFNKQCSKCHKMNHFANVCRSRALPHINEVEQSQMEKQTQDDWALSNEIGAVVNVNSIQTNQWTVRLPIFNSYVTCKIDTGADVNVLSLKTLKSLNLPNSFCIVPSTTQLEAYGGSKINLVGEILLPVNFLSKLYNTTFIIVDNDKATPILGRNSSEAMGLVRRNNISSITQNTCSKRLIDDNKDTFFNKGCFPEVIQLKLKDVAIPKSYPTRREPKTIADRLIAKVEYMECHNIIQKCHAGPNTLQQESIDATRKDKTLSEVISCKVINKNVLLNASTFRVGQPVLVKNAISKH
jgi:hypothetical protein